jgi:hypothetical protein
MLDQPSRVWQARELQGAGKKRHKVDSECDVDAVKQSGTVYPRPAIVLVSGFLKRGAWDSPEWH